MKQQEHTTKACGIIPLEDVIVRTATSKRKYCFQLFSTQEQVKAMKIEAGAISKGHHDSYFICAESQQEMQEWIDAISNNIFTNPYQALIEKKKLLQKDGKEIKKSLNVSANSSNETQSNEIDFEELLGFARMCNLCYDGASIVRQTWPSATCETYRDINCFVLTAQKVNTIVLSGCKWDKAATLQADLKKHKSAIVDYYQIQPIAKQLLKVIGRLLKKEYATVIIGHSVGGTVAMHIASNLQKKGTKINKIVTFGSPKDTPEKSIDQFSTLPLIRVVHHLDYVPLLFQGFVHCGVKITLLKDTDYSLIEPSDNDPEAKRELFTEERLSENHIKNYIRYDSFSFFFFFLIL